MLFYIRLRSTNLSLELPSISKGSSLLFTSFLTNRKCSSGFYNFTSKLSVSSIIRFWEGIKKCICVLACNIHPCCHRRVCIGLFVQFIWYKHTFVETTLSGVLFCFYVEFHRSIWVLVKLNYRNVFHRNAYLTLSTLRFLNQAWKVFCWESLQFCKK